MYYDTDAFTDQALIWLNEYQHTQKPFLLYLASTTIAPAAANRTGGWAG